MTTSDLFQAVYDWIECLLVLTRGRFIANFCVNIQLFEAEFVLYAIAEESRNDGEEWNEIDPVEGDDSAMLAAFFFNVRV